jgi:hypothetical protein
VSAAFVGAGDSPSRIDLRSSLRVEEGEKLEIGIPADRILLFPEDASPAQAKAAEGAAK